MDAKQRILDAADQLFGEVGLDAATTRAIAERSGANKALIHYHFTTKDELFGAVLDRYYEQLAAALGPALATEGSLRARLVGLVDAYVDFLAGHRGFFRIVQREIAGGRHVDRIAEHMLPLFRAGVALLTEAYPATRQGALAAPSLLVSFYGMVATHFGYAPVVARLVGSEPLSAEGLAHHKRHLARMVDLMLAALEAETQAPAPAPPRRGARRRQT